MTQNLNGHTKGQQFIKWAKGNQPDLTTKEIAEQVGYNSHHFNTMINRPETEGGLPLLMVEKILESYPAAYMLVPEPFRHAVIVGLAETGRGLPGPA